MFVRKPPTPVRSNRCYDLIAAAAAIGLPSFTAGILLFAEIPDGLRLAGLLAVAACLVWSVARFVRQTEAGLEEAIIAAASASASSVDRYTTMAAGFRELGRHQEVIAQRLSDQAAAQALIERDLGASTSLLRTAYAALDDALLVVDRSGRLVLVNSAADELLGLTDEHINRPLVEVLRAPQIHDVLKKAIETGVRVTGRANLSRPERVAMVVASPLPTDPGGSVLLVQDETELRKLERMRRDFVGNVSHELKTPLTSIQAYADTLLDGGLEDPELAPVFLDRIVTQADRLGSMIVDMLDLARLETELELPSREPVNADRLLTHLTSNFSVLAESAELTLTGTAPADSYVSGDEPTLRTILDNLIKNAIEHTPSGGEVEVFLDLQIPEAARKALKTASKTVCIHVRDTGVGIPRELQDRVFERFFRVDKSRNRQLGGSGLGLAIVKHAVERLGGHVGVTSRVGEGSTFHVTLPGSLTGFGRLQHAKTGPEGPPGVVVD